MWSLHRSNVLYDREKTVGLGGLEGILHLTGLDFLLTMAFVSAFISKHISILLLYFLSVRTMKGTKLHEHITSLVTISLFTFMLAVITLIMPNYIAPSLVYLVMAIYFVTGFYIIILSGVFIARFNKNKRERD